MAENLVSKFTVNSQGTDIDVKIKDEDARNLIAQEISDRSKLIKTDENNNTVIETSNKLIESSQGREINVNGIVNETVNNLTLVGKNELKFKSESLVLDSIGEPIILGMNVADDLYYGTLKVREASGNVREIMVKNNGTPNLVPAIKFTNYILVGDSYAEGWTPDGNVTGWPVLLHNLLGGNLYASIIQGGSGLSDKQTGIYNLTTRISELTNNDSVDSIICCCGKNDINSGELVNGINNGIKNFVDTCHQKFRNAKVYIGFIGWDLNKQAGWTTGKSLDLKNGIAEYERVTSDYTYLNTDFIMRQRSYLSSDGVHPNQTGQNALAYGIKCALYGGTPSFTKPFKQHKYKDNYGNNEYIINENFTGGTTFLQFITDGSTMYYGPKESLTLSNYELTMIKNVELEYLVPSGFSLTSMQARVLLKTTDSIYYAFDAPIYFKSNSDGTYDLVMNITLTNQTGTDWARGTIEFILLYGSISVANPLT